MRMRVDENILGRPELHKQMQNFTYVSALCRAGVELSVRESTGSAFPVAIVGLRIDRSLTGKPGHIDLACMNILAALENHRTNSQRYKFQGSEHSCRTGTHHNHHRGIMDIPEFRKRIRLIMVLRAISFVLITPYRLLTGIDRALLEHPFHPRRFRLYLLQSRFPRKRTANFKFFHLIRLLQAPIIH